jgi:hypothetical protein
MSMNAIVDVVDDALRIGTCKGSHQRALARLLKTGTASPEDLAAIATFFTSLAERRIQWEVKADNSDNEADNSDNSNN